MPDQHHDLGVSFSHVLQQELDEIAFARGKRRVKTDVPHDGTPMERASTSKLLGLAFSGGGIRSATFNLGVLQGLAKFGILPELDYLSTVSGGGYIGAWFLSLLKKDGTAGQVDNVQRILGPEEAHHPEHESQSAISFLRQYSNYLTPRFAFYSADIWTMVATWVRNTSLNLFLLLASIGTLLMLPRLIGLWFASFPTAIDPDAFPRVLRLALGLGTLILLWRLHRGPKAWPKTLGRFVLAGLVIAPAWLLTPKWAAGNCDGVDAVGTLIFVCLAVTMVCLNVSGKLRFGQAGVQIGIVLPLLISSVFMARWLNNAPEIFAKSEFLASIMGPALLLFVFYLAIACLGGVWSCFIDMHQRRSRWKLWLWIRGAALVLLVAAVPAVVSALLLWAVADTAPSWDDGEKPWFLFTWGPPIVLVGMALGVIIQLGMIGRDFDAAAREWFGRLRAWTLIYSCGWMIICGAGIYGPLWVVMLILAHPWAGATLTGGWLGTTITGVLAGKGSGTSGRPGAKGTGTGGGNRTLDLITRIAPFVFMAGFILAISFGIHMLLSWGLVEPGPAQSSGAPSVHFVSTPNNVTVNINGKPAPGKSSYFAAMKDKYFLLLTRTPDYLWGTNPQRHFISGALNLFVILFAAALLLSFRLDINVFSLHEFYKNRLVRCYLGAVRCRTRKPNLFTGFDDEDDHNLTGFNGRQGGRYCGPYPIINTTMNVSFGQNLAWQQRKSVPFIFTPLYCGYNVDGGNEAMRIDEQVPATEPASGMLSTIRRKLHLAPEDLCRFGYRRTGVFCYPRGIHLGTAVAVSGAATSPNMGFHTATPVAFLMTVFDVRLGWWVGNPRRDFTYDRSTPRFNLLTFAQELFGLTDASSAYVNLSDGGHFDNMGLYELIRRRCRYIVVSDAEQDPDLTFASLTTVLRTCRTDFGVEISIALDRISRNEKGECSAHCVVGKIAYPEAPDNPGYLLYLKSSLTGDEPADVTGYHTGHPEFPHQTTADQWFSEAQFESYRKLGAHVVESAMGRLRSKPAEREDFFSELYDRWYPPSDHVDRSSAGHSQRFTDLTLALSDQEHLDTLDTQIFTAWTDGSQLRGRSAREQLYYATAFIAFMHTVYRDLDLESEHERNHPHNAGWLRIFRYWVHQPAFRDAWNRTHKMYGVRFQVFYEDLLNQNSTRIDN